MRRSATVGLLTASGPFLWRQLAHAQEAPVEQVHAQFGADAATQAAFSWMTPAAVATPFLQLGEQRLPATTIQYEGYPGYFHHVRVDDLLPSTDYGYAIGHGDTIRREGFSYRTGPAPGTPFTFTAFADQGTDFLGGDLTQVQDFDPTTLQTIAKGADQQPPFQATRNRDLAYSFDPAFHLVGGDTSYANGNQDVWDEWFRGYEQYAASRPVMPAIGNHEIEVQGVGVSGFGTGDSWGPLGYDAYRHRFALPANGDREWEGCWYRFRYGSVEFISLDNNDVNTEVTANIGYSEGRQEAWAAEALRAAHEDETCDFIIVMMHQAAFSTGLHGSDQGVRDAWFELFATYDVDLVLQGHDHQYERTHMMVRDEVALAAEGDYVTDIGTMYVVCGNGGAVQRPQNPLPNEFPWQAAKSVFTVGTVKVDVVPDTGSGTKRLVLGEYSVTTGGPVEEGIVIERTRQAATQPAPTPTPATTPTATPTPTPAPTTGDGGGSTTGQSQIGQPSTTTVLPATGGPAGIGMVGVSALGAAAATTAWVRGRKDEEVQELRGQRGAAEEE
ncbi:Purple acid phosphatase [Euzebya pacifica]|uniref:Purple acid phosphatase n=2 Tax=Euzebya pacifica TaxID=1608957 RepID=A0A346Y436_9ACTN|nr:Purple acid phosphatase [Euzebya pacifica]